MSLNWKEIDRVLGELDLAGAQIQGAWQSAFDVLGLKVYKRGAEGRKGATRQILIALSPGACRLHETYGAFPKSAKPLRFAQFLSSRLVNGWIQEAVQLGDDRIVRLTVRRGEERFRLYVRLWSNAANVVATDDSGAVLDAMRRLPKRGEVSGGRYAPEKGSPAPREGKPREYEVRDLPPAQGALPFNAAVDAFYAEHGSALSLEALREQARRECEGSVGRLRAALGRLRDKEKDFADSGRLREYGDIILANIARVTAGDEWLEADDFFAGAGSAASIRIKLDRDLSPSANAELYYAQHGKARKGLADVRREIESGEREIEALEGRLAALLEETNPLVLARLVRGGSAAGKPRAASGKGKKRPGLTFQCGDWLVLVGRDAEENDALLRRHVKGGDLWLHARDFAGSYVFVKQRAGKSFPLETMLDAGNLAIFYSKGRNSAEGDLFYTQVKHLRRAKNGPKGLVIPTQEKNLRVRLDAQRLRRLEGCRVD